MSCVLAEEVNETGNFTELNSIIKDADMNIDLTKDYEYIDGDDDVIISKSIRINGNNHNVNNTESPIFITANDSNVIFEEINFFNQKFEFLNNSNLNVTFINCNFNFTKNSSCESLYINQFDEMQTTGEISPTVKKLAMSIVGNSEDYVAAYKLAVWVGKNIKHEYNSGFYQTPDVTLARKHGNCCSQTDLFLQMCAAVGLDKNHKLYYVHVGTMKYGKRHFFAMIDNLLVDVDARPSYPWGHANLKNYEVYRITEYPYLPLPKEY